MSRTSITSFAGVLALIAPALVACAVDETAPLATGPRTVDVAPRVVMDGLIELGARADRVIVDQVLFHAPQVSERLGDDLLSDVLASDPENQSPLLFRYDVASRDGFGDVLGGERRWTFEGDGDLVVGFEHFQMGAPERRELERGTGVDLAELTGHTAVVHGFMLTAAAAATASGFTNPCGTDGDPDGNPAQCQRGKRSDGDPDGNPADGDPDGNPAHPKAQDGDPDGNPSQDPNASDDGKHVDHGLSASETVIGVHERGSYSTVPFFLVLDDRFTLRVPVRTLLAGDVESGQVLPIDLHVALDNLLTDELLHQLDQQANDDVAGPIVVRVPSGTAAFAIDVQAEGVTRVRQTVNTGSIRVVADPR